MTRSWIAAALLSSLLGVGTVTAEGTDATPGAAAAAADAPRAKKPARIPYRVVKLMPESAQAVVYDRATSEHLLVQIGDDLGDFQVIDVDDEELVLWSDGREIVLTLDPTAPAPAAVLAHRPAHVVSAADASAPSEPTVVAAPAAAVPTVVAAPAAAVPTVVAAPASPLMDPYAAPAPTVATSAPAPAAAAPAPTIDPYADATAPVPTVVSAAPAATVAAPAVTVAATIDPYGDATAPAPTVVPAPAPATVPTVVPAPATAAAATVVPAPTTAPAPTVVPAPAAEDHAAEIRSSVMSLERGKLSAAVDSFDRLAKDYGFEKTPRGVRLVRVAPDSFAYGMGLRAGDVITAIDGAPLRGLDDAAAAYVGMDTATSLSLDVERGAAHGTLKFAIR